MSEPVSLSFIFSTIGILVTLTAIGIVYVKLNKPKG